ncbi:putative Heterokaryon incompatibility domain-containing protein [Seiridium unicorne]|uniref:Heterokaryon incompatibility domain-containing protein n=1 Tax=Seiridium unicorne TaxID=138068 RepID=A0ABR2V361_9PEZI
MRLINAHSLKLEDFRSAADAPEYAVLSHTWGEAEPNFTEWNSYLTRLRKAKQPGFAKVYAACKQARRDKISHVWVDTICIDKSSSAELSEAINSMYFWYQSSKLCYAYLKDVSGTPSDQTDPLDLFKRSRWFTRGWTLQELLAPGNVVFFTQSWTVLGTRNALASTIAAVTGIDQRCLTKEIKLRNYSVAQRMSWAANRSTTREEDIAYCLLGIFRINMPLVYGEGLRAFRRLQEEIIRTYDDQSILAFDNTLSKNSVLADHPRLFHDAGQIQPNFAPRITPPFSMTNAGMAIRTPLILTLSPFWVLAVLNCIEMHAKGGVQKSQICLPLFGKDGTFMRARAPVHLIRRALTDAKPGVMSDISDLATTTNAEYLISYFTRVYPVFGNELDPALNGFDTDEALPSGFMLTFPRGMGDWHLREAYPKDALQRETSFFVPTVSHSGQSFPHGVLVFENDTFTPPSRIGIYLAHTMDIAEDGGSWMCQITPVLDAAEELYKVCNNQWLFEEVPEKWPHYHCVNNFIVAARTQFSYGTPERQVVMVEMVFDADALLRERGL